MRTVRTLGLVLMPVVFSALLGCSSPPSLHPGAVVGPGRFTPPAGPGDPGSGQPTEGVNCFICGKTFDTFDKLADHMETAHKKCPACGIILADDDELKAHMEEAHRDMPWEMSVWMGAYIVVITGVYAAAGFLLGG